MPFGTERADVGIRANEHSHIAQERAHAPNGALGRREAENAVFGARDERPGQIRRQDVAHGDGTGARPSPAVRRGERLVHVDVHDVEAHVARTRLAQDRVQVRAVSVGECADRVDRTSDLEDVLVEEPQRVGVREHDGGHVGVQRRLQGVEVHASPIVGRYLRDVVAAHRHGRGVRPVRSVGDHDTASDIALVGEVGANRQQSGELAVSPRGGLQRDRVQPDDLGQRLREGPEHLEEALHGVERLVRVHVRESRQARRPLVQSRVVLHRARAERIEAGVDAEVRVRERLIVAGDVDLGHVRQIRVVSPGTDLQGPAPSRCSVRPARAP